MPCYYPIKAWQLESGSIVFAERGKVRRDLWLPCSRCIGCRLERSRQWAVRCMHESQLHADNMFVTLTYDDEHLPADHSLNYDHYQGFMKRLRSKHGKVRFFMCGEYGEKYKRPHYHACIFGLRFSDLNMWRKSAAGFPLYRSKSLEKLWSFGSSEVGDVSFDSAAYVARYICKKVTGPDADKHYQVVDADTGEIFQREPEFARMSLKPGIGAGWFDKFGTEVFPLDRVVINGSEAKPPRYYDKLQRLYDEDISDHVEYSRYKTAVKRGVEDSTDDRLAVREMVKKASLKNLKRSLE